MKVTSFAQIKVGMKIKYVCNGGYWTGRVTDIEGGTLIFRGSYMGKYEEKEFRIWDWLAFEDGELFVLDRKIQLFGD